jgi:hypothetical protein
VFSKLYTLLYCFVPIYWRSLPVADSAGMAIPPAPDWRIERRRLRHFDAGMQANRLNAFRFARSLPI